MPELPNTYARRPAPRFGGVRRANPVVVDGDFAEGQAMQRFGADVAQTFVGLQLQADKFELESKTTEYRREALALKQDWETKRGKDVAENDQFYTEYVTRNDQLKAKYLEKASNHRVTNALAQRLEVADINLKENLIGYISKENEVYQTQVYRGSMAVNIDTMAANPYNDSEIAQSRDNIVAATELYAEANGLPTEAKDAMIKESLTKGHVSVITARIDDGQYEQAEAYFWENKDQIDGTQHASILKALEKSGQAARTQDLSDSTYLEFQDDEKGGLAYIRANAAPEDRDEAIRRLKNRYAEDRTQRNDLWDTAGTIVRGQYASAIADDADTRTPSEIWDSIPLSEKLAMKPSELLAMESKVAADAAGTPVKTDIASYFAVESALRDLMQTDPEAARALDLSKFANVISGPDLKTLNTMRNKDPKILGSETNILNEGLLAIGIEPKKLNTDSSDGKKARAFQTWVRNNLSPDYDKKELQDTINRGIIKVVTDPGWFWDSEEFAYTAGEKFVVPGVPSERVDEYAAALTKLGYTPDIRTVMAAHAVVVSGKQLSVAEIDAMLGTDLTGGELPTYEKMGQDFPGG